jgi:hypothetical protein
VTPDGVQWIHEPQAHAVGSRHAFFSNNVPVCMIAAPTLCDRRTPRQAVRFVPVRTALAVVLLVVGAWQPVRAQSEAVPLQLVHRVGAPGEAPYGSEPLPAGTEIVVVPLDGWQARTIPNLAPRTRDTLVARGQEQERDTLRADGSTPSQHASTRTTGHIYYVLARTPTGTLHESYVNTGTVDAPAFVPGADAVQTGRMTIGPVPDDAQATMQAVFTPSRVASGERADADPSSDVTTAESASPDTTTAASSDPAPAASETKPTAGNDTVPTSTSSSVEMRTASTTSRATTAPQQAQRRARQPASSPLDGWWWLLSGAGGLLVGIGVGWGLQYGRWREAVEDRDYWRSRYREEQARAYRQATGIQLDGAPTGADDDVRPEHHADEQDPDALRTANAELYAENQELKRRLREVKSHIQSMREGGRSSTQTGAS